MVLFEKNLSNSAVFIFHSDVKKKFVIKVEDGQGKVKSYQSKYKNPFGVPCCVHEVELSHLEGGQNYKIKIHEINKKYWFKTGDKTGTILMGGDSRSDISMRQKMNVALRDYVKKNPETFALIHGGDYIKNGLSWGQWKQWLSDYQLTTDETGRLLPLIPIRGNHEYLSFYFNSLFSRPSGGCYQNYYLTNWGDLSFVHLNTNLSHAGKQRKWLESSLSSLSTSSKWIIPNYHRPAYPGVKKPGDALRYWVPLFEKYNVDVVFESDGHVYKKTAPIFAGKVNREKGIRYLGEGGLGVALCVSLKNQESGIFLGMDGLKKKYHFFAIEKLLDKIYIHSIDENLSAFDSIELRPKKR